MVIMNETQLQEVAGARPLDGITLQPFLHQVSGRAIMMSLNETTVCKPLNSREYCFYQNLPREMRQYTPQYRGVVNVNIEETTDGTIALTAYPPNDEDSANSKDSDSDNEVFEPCNRNGKKSLSAGDNAPRKRIRLKRTGSLCIERGDETLEKDTEKSPAHNTKYNPWMLKVYKEGLRRHLCSKNKVTQKCILLENVTSRFKFPCILDLKMGTRLHGDFDDTEKQKRHQEKSAASTTQSLGVRLAGMQVYRHESGNSSFHCRNKYFGRGLSVEGFRKTLQEYFYNGHRMRTECILPIIEKLRTLKKRLTRLPSYRFYSSSLLVMYDGVAETADFNSRSDGDTDDEYEGQQYSDISFSEDASSKDYQSSRKSSTQNAHKSVDVRMIDFAKTTYQNMNESVIHHGPDSGYIFGLENLIQVLSDILVEEMNQ